MAIFYTSGTTGFATLATTSLTRYRANPYPDFMTSGWFLAPGDREQRISFLLKLFGLNF